MEKIYVNILNKIKKSKKLLIFLGILAIISLLIISSNIFNVDVKPLGQSAVQKILAEFPIEYQVKNINDDGTYEILVIISSDSGINSVNYQNENGQDITLDCAQKLSVAIDYKVEENQTYYFYVDRVNEGKVIEKIYIERAVPQDGSEMYPYIIRTAEQLQNINSKLDAHYKLGANIDLNGRTWETIGNQTTPFKGELNGNGYIITNLTINKQEDNIGLFGYNQGTLKNIKLDNFNVTGKDNVGALVGYSTGSIIGNTSNAVVNGNSNVGGLVGYAYSNNANLTIESLSSAGKVTGTTNVGGLVGNSNINHTNSAENITYTMFIKKSYSSRRSNRNNKCRWISWITTKYYDSI